MDIRERRVGTIPMEGIPVTNPVFKNKEHLSKLEWRELQIKLAKWLKAEEEGRLLVLPRKPGSVVYTVVGKCRPDYTQCPFSGGYGTARCTQDNSRCGPYVDMRLYNVQEFPKEKCFDTKEEAEAELKSIYGDRNF